MNKKSIISTKKSWDIDHNTIIEFLTTCFKNIFSVCRKFGLRNLNWCNSGTVPHYIVLYIDYV